VLLCFRLDVYIHDYFLKRKLHTTAKTFMTEAKVSTDPVGKKLRIKIVDHSLLCCVSVLSRFKLTCVCQELGELY
jgi:hypothetical protein